MKALEFRCRLYRDTTEAGGIVFGSYTSGQWSAQAPGIELVNGVTLRVPWMTDPVPFWGGFLGRVEFTGSPVTFPFYGGDQRADYPDGMTLRFTPPPPYTPYAGEPGHSAFPCDWRFTAIVYQDLPTGPDRHKVTVQIDAHSLLDGRLLDSIFTEVPCSPTDGTAQTFRIRLRVGQTDDWTPVNEWQQISLGGALENGGIDDGLVIDDNSPSHDWVSVTAGDGTAPLHAFWPVDGHLGRVAGFGRDIVVRKRMDHTDRAGIWLRDGDDGEWRAAENLSWPAHTCANRDQVQWVSNWRPSVVRGGVSDDLGETVATEDGSGFLFSHARPNPFRDEAVAVWYNPDTETIEVYGLPVSPDHTTVAAPCRASDEFGGTPCPVLFDLPTGGWECGTFIAGLYRSWRAPLDLSEWTARDDQAIDADTIPVNLAVWRTVHGQDLAAGYCADTAEPGLGIWFRPGVDQPWQRGGHVALDTCVTPYIVERRDGRLELGWRLAGEWHQRLADHPAAHWSAP